MSHVFECYRENKFGATAIKIGWKEFMELGFEYGDSVDLVFSGGQEFRDIPYYSGFHAHRDEIILAGTKWYPSITVVISQGNSHWDVYGIQEGDTVEISLRERGKYLIVQSSLSAEYTNNRDDYSSDAVFANFREVQGGSLKKRMFYRGASPCCDRCGRALYGEALCREKGIKFALNLSDDVEHVKGFLIEHEGNLPYYQSLFEDNKVLPMGMTTYYHGEGYSRDVGQGFLQMVRNEGPCYIHCLEGKDRTGFVCMLLLSLAKASVEEIIRDYMITYDNYYHINEKDTPDKYQAIVNVKAWDYLILISGKEDISQITARDMYEGARTYLKMGGLTDGELDEICAGIGQYE